MRKPVPISISFVAALGIFLIACLASSTLPESQNYQQSTDTQDKQVEEKFPTTELSSEPLVDSLPQSKLDWKLVDQLAKGIRQFNTIRGQLYWYECGERYSEREADHAAHEWARTIVHACMIASDETVKLNPWMVAGTVANESRFDRCSLGPGPREQAEKLGFVKPSRKTLSRKRHQIERYLKSRRWRSLKQAGPDIGGLQVLSGYVSIPPERMMTLEPGMYAQIQHMRKRCNWCKHRNRPWGCWPGRYTAWYDYQIKKRAMRLGAPHHQL